MLVEHGYVCVQGIKYLHWKTLLSQCTMSWIEADSIVYPFATNKQLASFINVDFVTDSEFFCAVYEFEEGRML